MITLRPGSNSTGEISDNIPAGRHPRAKNSRARINQLVLIQTTPLGTLARWSGSGHPSLPCRKRLSPGGVSTEANFIDPSTGSLLERRAALKAVDVVDSAPVGARDLGGVSARRCHRYVTEAEPLASSLIPDLQIAAYGQGADVIRVLGVEKKMGLLADCWYVLEGRAEMYSFQKP